MRTEIRPFLLVARESGGLPCPHCISSTMNVIANKAHGQVSEMEGEHNVLTTSGEYSPSKLLKRNHSGEIYSITPWLQNEPIEITPEHPMLTQRGWIVPSKLSISDMLFIPKHKLKKKSYLNLIDYLTIPHMVKDGLVFKTFTNEVTNKLNYRDSHKIRKKIPLDEGFMRLCGYFVAEGCIHQPQSRKATFSLTFSKKEQGLVEDARALIEKYLTHCVVSDTKTARQVRVHSHIVCNLFENLFGSKSYKKRVPHWLLHLPLHLQAEFFKGYFLGDGSSYLEKKEEHRSNLSITTTSKALAYQLRLLLVNLGILPYIYRHKRSIASINGRILKNNTEYSYCLMIYRIDDFNKLSSLLNIGVVKSDVNKVISKYSTRQKNGFWVKIKSITKQNFSGIVYNFNVTTDPTYLVNNVVVHNCSRAALIVAHVNNVLREPIDILCSDEPDPRIHPIADYFAQKYGEPAIPTPLLYLNGMLVIGVTTILNYIGVMKGLMTNDTEYR